MDQAENTAADPPDAPASVFSFEVKATKDDVMRKDDGTSEFGWAIPPGEDGDMKVQVLTPSGYPSYLTEVVIQLEQSCNGIFEFEVKIYSDITGGNPSDATLVWTSGPQTEGMQENYVFEWFDFDVAESLADTPLMGGTWVVGVMNNSGQMYLGGDTDYTVPDPDSWNYHRDTGLWESMEEYYLSWEGTFAIRGTGFYIVE